MTAKYDTENTGILMLHIMRCIPKNGKVSAREVRDYLAAQGFSRDERTVKRHLNTLCEHFDIEWDNRSKPHGYSWKSHARGFDIPLLTEQESLFLMLAREHLRYLLPDSVMYGMKPVFERAAYTLQNHNLPDSRWLEKVSVAPQAQPLCPPQIDPAILANVSTALYRDNLLLVRYRNQNGKVQESAVMPLGLVQQGENLYLVVHFEGYEDERHLAVHRLLSAEISTRSFTRPEKFDLHRYVAEGLFGFSTRRKVRLEFSISKSAGFHLTETPLSPDQELLEENESAYRFRATVTDSAMLDWWLRKFGDDISDICKEILPDNSENA